MAGLRIRDLGSAFAAVAGAFASLADLNLSGNQLSGAQGLAHLTSITALNLNSNRCAAAGARWGSGRGQVWCWCQVGQWQGAGVVLAASLVRAAWLVVCH